MLPSGYGPAGAAWVMKGRGGVPLENMTRISAEPSAVGGTCCFRPGWLGTLIESRPPMMLLRHPVLAPLSSKTGVHWGGSKTQSSGPPGSEHGISH